jgi:hypothetical protein
MTPLLRRTLLASSIAAAGLPAAALDFKLGDDIDAKVDGTLTLGTSLRTEDPSPEVLGTLSTARVGLPAGRLGGNSGGNDLNFRKNRPVSTVLKGVASLQLTRGDFSLFVRAKAWHDQELQDGKRDYGNIPNRFAQGVPLGDAGFDPHARFSNAQLEDAYVSGRFRLGDGMDLQARLGRQLVGWTGAQLIGGGVAIVNPNDLPSQVRPGAQPDEARIPVGMLQAHLSLGKDSSVEAFVPYEFRPTVLNPCGTFFAVANYAPTGCNYVGVLGGQGVNDPTALASGRYPKRNPDVLASDSGQWGLSGSHRWPATGTELRAHVMNIHSRTPSIRITNPSVAGGYGNLAASNPTRLTDPNGIRYAMVWQEDIRFFGLGATQHFSPSLRVYGELSYRPNQPLAINPSDLIAAFLQRSPNSALNLARGVLALPPGAPFDGVDRYKVGALTLGLFKAFEQLAGAQRVTFAAEIGTSHVGSLPAPGQLRYGRSDDYGGAAVSGGAPCVDNTAARKSCAQEGFVTASAWGYRLRVAATYPNAFFGASLTPSLALAHDVQGNSFDGIFLDGRKAIRTALRADWGRQFFAELQLNVLSGGTYNTLIDRDTVTLFAGTRF